MGVKPAGDLVQTAEPVLRLAAAGKLVVLAAEENKAALHAVRRERGKEYNYQKYHSFL